MSSNDASLPPRLPTPRNRPSPRRRLRHRQSPSSFPLPPLFLPVRIFRNQPGPLLHFAQALTRPSRLRSVLQFRRPLRSPPSRHKQHQLPTRLRRRIPPRHRSLCQRSRRPPPRENSVPRSKKPSARTGSTNSASSPSSSVSLFSSPTNFLRSAIPQKSLSGISSAFSSSAPASTLNKASLTCLRPRAHWRRMGPHLFRHLRDAFRALHARH